MLKQNWRQLPTSRARCSFVAVTALMIVIPVLSGERLQAQELTRYWLVITATKSDPESYLRAVPAVEGQGQRRVRMSESIDLGIGIEYRMFSAPLAFRMSGAADVNAKLQHQEYRSASCGTNCARIYSSYTDIGDLTSIRSTVGARYYGALGIAEPFVGAGLAGHYLRYDASRMPEHVRSSFPANDHALYSHIEAGINILTPRNWRLGLEIARFRTILLGRNEEGPHQNLQPQMTINYSLVIAVPLGR